MAVCDDAAVFAVRRSTPEDLARCVAIIRGLPDYFTDDVPEKVAHDLGRHQGWVIADGVDVAGFAIVERRSPQSVEILWAAVLNGRRGSGQGGVLVDHVLGVLWADGVRVVEVKTLDRSANYPPYEATRGFWEGHGFVHVDTIDPLPGWQPGNPAALYVCALGATR
jgi:GNAT superfamily N-acetyltransferase